MQIGLEVNLRGRLKDGKGTKLKNSPIYSADGDPDLIFSNPKCMRETVLINVIAQVVGWGPSLNLE